MLNFGIEVEGFNVKSQHLVDKLNEVGLLKVARSKGIGSNTTELENLTADDHIKHNCWKLTKDNSIKPTDRWPVEIVSPILSNLSKVETLFEGLATTKFQVNSTCGFHVHIDARSLTWKDCLLVAENYYNHQNWFDVYTGRVDNKFCLPVSIVELYSCKSKLHTDALPRYRALNLWPLHCYGTLEFRQHGGTLSYDIAAAWIMLCQAMVEERKTIRRHKLFGLLSSLDSRTKSLVQELHARNFCIDRKLEVVAEQF